MRRGHRLQRIHVPPREARPGLGGHKPRNLGGVAHHHLAEQHVLERGRGAPAVLRRQLRRRGLRDRRPRSGARPGPLGRGAGRRRGGGAGQGRQRVEGLEEVRERSPVVALVGVQRARLRVELGLLRRGDVGRRGCGPGRGERGPGPGEVAQGAVRARLEEVHVDEQQLVVEALDLRGQGGEDPQGPRDVARAEEQTGQAGVEALAEEGALLGAGPGGLLPAHAELFFL